MPDPSWQRTLGQVLERLDESHLRRQRHAWRAIDATHVELADRVLVNFASNNYLGLTHHPRLIEAAAESLRASGAGAGAAGLITGFTPAHASGERALSRWKQTERAVLLPSGYQANLAAIQTIAGVAGAVSRPVRFLVDKLAHASLWDAVRCTGAAMRIFPHNHIPKLERLLRESDPAELQVVVTESIFSMDGDAADLKAIARLKQSHAFVLLVDEAHATGIYGPTGNGLVAELGLTDAVDVSVVTLSKAMGLCGGAVCASADFCDALLNYGRAYVFSTALPAYLPAAAEAAIEVISADPHRRQRVRVMGSRVRSALAQMSHPMQVSDSPIVPVILGDEAAALQAAEALRERGLLVVAVRPPSVPRGSSRLRITLCSEHTDVEVDDLIAALKAALPKRAL